MVKDQQRDNGESGLQGCSSPPLTLLRSLKRGKTGQYKALRDEGVNGYLSGDLEIDGVKDVLGSCPLPLRHRHTPSSP